MIINDKYEFRDKDGNEIEPTMAQLLTFTSDILQKRDDEIKKLNKHLTMFVKAFGMACEEIVDHVGDCPYSAKNLEMPPEEWCDKHCYDGKRNPIMCWDVYLLEQARKELGIEDD